MATGVAEREGFPPAFLVDPASLHILLVDTNSTSRQQISSLLRDCGYQVTACKTSAEAIQLLKAQQSPEGTAGFDLILKEHCPAAGTNACRLLRRAQTESVLRGIPIIVASTTEDRDVMVSCLQLGAADYMLKPLRNNELRNLWARVYWWRRASYLQQHPSGSANLPAAASPAQSLGSGGSDETKCCSDDDEPQMGMIGQERSGEGSAPNASHGNGSGNGSRENGSGGNGSKEGLGWSGNQAKPGNGNSGDGNGNSATKAEQASNQPSSDAGQAQDTSKLARSSAPSAQLPPLDSGLYAPLAQPGRDLLQIAPLDVVAVPRPTVSAPRSDIRAPELRPSGAGTGFRAYVAKENPRKRPPEPVVKEEGGRSSGSDRTEKPEAVKRRPIARLGSVQQPAVSEAQASEATFAGTSGPARQPSGSAPMQFDRQTSASVGWSPSPGQAASAFSNFYPYGVMPPFPVPPQFWAQMQGGVPGSEADMSTYYQFTQQSQQGSKAIGSTTLQQQQQQAMHNQLMFQHSILMQQYGMSGGAFPFPFPGQAAVQGQSGTVTSSAALALAAKAAVGPAVTARPFQGRDSSGDALTTRNGSGTWNAGTAGASGLMTGTGTGNGGNTLGGHGAGTGATSHHTVAQVGLDGCLVEPSRQARRAQALHKYKQKRKKLCFTKKIRYESRKQLAQARPRVKGQFVRVRSDDVADVADAMKAQKAGGSAEDAAVPQLALERAGGDEAVAAQLMEAAKTLNNPPGEMENSEEEEFEEEEEEEDDDVNSPATQSGLGGSAPPAAAAANPLAAPPEGNGKVNGTSRHSSDSGSNSPELNNGAPQI